MIHSNCNMEKDNSKYLSGFSYKEILEQKISSNSDHVKMKLLVNLYDLPDEEFSWAIELDHI